VNRDRLAGTAGPRDDRMDEVLRALAEPRPPRHPAAGGPFGALRDEIVGCFDVTDCGELLMIERFAEAWEDGAMGIFTTREAAEEFVGGDPFVLHGVVRNWTVRNWNEAVVPEQPSLGRWVICRRPVIFRRPA
jgi:hypothetical protein